MGEEIIKQIEEGLDQIKKELLQWADETFGKLEETEE